MARDFRNADAIQQELLQGGVYVHDGFKQWRADGTNFEGYGSKTYQYVGGASELSDEQSKEIKELIEERARFKAERLYRNADAIRDELRDRFRVVVDDRKREWMIGDSRRLERGGRDRFSSFTMADFSEQPDNQEEIQELVEKRDKARADRDFATADDIRDNLLQQGITINDIQKINRIGGKIFEQVIWIAQQCFFKRSDQPVSRYHLAYTCGTILNEKCGLKESMYPTCSPLFPIFYI